MGAKASAAALSCFALPAVPPEKGRTVSPPLSATGLKPERRALIRMISLTTDVLTQQKKTKKFPVSLSTSCARNLSIFCFLFFGGVAWNSRSSRIIPQKKLLTLVRDEKVEELHPIYSKSQNEKCYIIIIGFYFSDLTCSCHAVFRKVMPMKQQIEQDLSLLKRFTLVSTVIWTIVLGSSLFWSILHAKHDALDMATHATLLFQQGPGLPELGHLPRRRLCAH
ncbi:MAG: hypothetical protein WC633_09350 [Desulfurivibrionaceae bacterium]